MGLERFPDEAIGLAKHAEPIADYQMGVNDQVVRPYGSGALPHVDLATAAALSACTAAGAGKGKTLTKDAFGAETIDGVVTALGDLVLVKDQASSIDNGIYKVTTIGAAAAYCVLTRDVDYDTIADVALGTLFYVLLGTANSASIIHVSTSPAVLDTNDLDFTAGIYASITVTLPLVTEAKGKTFSILARGATEALTVTIADKDDSESWGGDYILTDPGDSMVFYSDGLKWSVLGAGGAAAEGVMSSKVTITSAQILLIRATPITLVPAPGANKVLVFESALLLLDYGGTNGFTESSDDLSVRYTDESGVVVSVAIESTGFIDQTADTYINAIPIVNAIVVPAGNVNQALVLHNVGDGEIAGNAGGDNVVEVWTTYRVLDIS